MRNCPTDAIWHSLYDSVFTRNGIGPLVVLLALLSPFSAIDSSAQENEGPPLGQPQVPLQPEYITGRVVDAAGEPISNFELLVRGGAVREDFPGTDGSRLQLTPISNPQGEFRIKHLTLLGAKQTIVVEAPGYVRKYHILDFGNGDQATDIRILLDEAASVQGKVVDTDGNAVPGAQIWIGPVPRPLHHGRPGPLAETDEDGSFVSDHFSPGKATLGILHPDYPAASIEVDLKLRDTNQLHLVLPSGVDLFGTVTFGESPVLDGIVEVTTKEGVKRTEITNGTFLLKGILQESTDVSFRAFRTESNDERATWSFRTRADFNNPIERRADVVFPTDSCGIQGELLVGGQVVGGQYARAIYLTRVGDSKNLQISTYANGRGAFSVSDMPAGEWNLHAHIYDKEAGSFNSQQRVTTRSGEITRLRIDFSPAGK